MAVTQIVQRMIAAAAVGATQLATGAVTLVKLGWNTAKGDLNVGTGTAGTTAILAVGADGTVLQADSTQTNGVKWGSPLVSGSFISNEVPTGTINGTNPTFTLANTPTAGSQKVYVNGLRMNPGTGLDYTFATATITFLTGAIPQTGDVILVDYNK